MPKILVVKNFNKNKINEKIIQKELCKIYNGEYRKSFRPKRFFMEILKVSMKYGSCVLINDTINLENIYKIFLRLNLESDIVVKHEEVFDSNYIILLNEGEYLCDKCGGFGSIFKEKTYNEIIFESCNKCNSKRKITWINEIKPQTLTVK